MTTTLFPDPTQQSPDADELALQAEEDALFARRLRHQTAAVRLMHSKLGVRRSLSRDQVNTAAEAFHADGDLLSASRRIIDTHDEAYRAVTSTISRARAYWRTMTVPFPIKGTRLIRKDLIPQFDEAMQKHRAELIEAVQVLATRYESLRLEARARLGDLFNEADYPQTIRQQFALQSDYPSVEPPNYLKELNPELYEQESRRMQQRFESALQLAEDAFAAELQGLVSHLVERLTTEADADGKPKRFHKTAVTNMSEFFERFQSLNVRGNSDLTALVQQAEQVLQNVDAADLRKDQSLRQFVAQGMEQVKSTLDAMVNVTSSVVVNDFAKRYFARQAVERTLVRTGQIASIVALALAFYISFAFESVIDAWQTMIFVVVTAVLVPATLRWHWWRSSQRSR